MMASHKNGRFLSFVVLTGWLVSVVGGQAVGQDSVILRVEERGGVDRTSEPVVSGIPLPRAWGVTDVSSLRLRDAGATPVPAQFEPLARWGAMADASTAPAKWVLVQFPVSVPSSGSATFTLDRGGPGPPPTRGLRIAMPTPSWTAIDTGVAIFDINTSSFNLIDRVRIGGGQLLNSLPANEALVYRPAGALGLVTSGTLPDLTPRSAAMQLERHDAMTAVMCVRGSLLNASGQAVLDYTARLYFTAGTADVRVDFTVENNHPILVDVDSGQPTNAHDQGSTYSVFIGSLQLRLRLAAGGALHALAEGGLEAVDPATSLTVYQDSSGTELWDAYVGNVGWENRSAHPRLQSYCAFRGFRVEGAGVTPVTGNHSEGWIAAWRAGADGPALSVAVRDFWQNFPKELAVEPDGTVTIDLFPRGEQFRHNLRVGEHKTHSVLLSFGRGPVTNDEAARRARAFNRPLLAVAPPAWYVGSGALGEVPVMDVARWPLYERYCRTAFEPNPDFDPAIHDPSLGNSTLRDAIRRYNFYGWQDYGDVPLDYEAFGDNQAGQMNLKYWFLYGMWIQFCRSGDLQWFDLARPASWHLADIDILHLPDEGPQHWAHGAYFGHSEHDEPGNSNPNRNHNSPSVDLVFGVPGLFLGYHLTGDRRFRDAALEELEGNLLMSQFSDFSNPVPHRDRPNLILAYLEGYRDTGDPRWLRELRTIVGGTADLSNKQEWLTSPTAFRQDDDWLSSFQFSQLLWACGKYLDFCDEYGITDDLGMANAFTAFGDFVIRDDPTTWTFMHEYLPGRAAARNSYWFFEPGYELYLEINTWALTMADALSYAYKYTRRQRFLDAAALFYATGTIDPHWLDDPPVYLDTKDLVNALNWGLVYMRQSSAPPPTRARPHWSLY